MKKLVLMLLLSSVIVQGLEGAAAGAPAGSGEGRAGALVRGDGSAAEQSQTSGGATGESATNPNESANKNLVLARLGRAEKARGEDFSTLIGELFLRYLYRIQAQDESVLSEIESLEDVLWDEIRGIKIETTIATTRNGSCPIECSLLGCAIIRGNDLLPNFLESLVKIFIKKGVVVDEIYDCNGWKVTTLGFAAMFCQATVINLLLDAGASIDGEPSTEKPLTLAAINNMSNNVQLFLRRGARINTPGCLNPRTPLCAAVDSQCVKSMMALLEAGAWIDQQQGYKGALPLHYAAANGNTNIASILIERGAAVESFNKQKATPLFLAIIFGHHEMVNLLLKHGAYVDSKMNFSWSPDEMVRDPRMAYSDFYDLVIKMSLVGQVPLAEKVRLFNYVAEPLEVDIDERRELMAQIEILDQMFSSERKKFIASNMTPLLLACVLLKTNIAASLLDAGADFSAIDGMLFSTVLKDINRRLHPAGMDLLVRMIERREVAKKQQYERDCAESKYDDADIEEILKQLGVSERRGTEGGRGKHNKPSGRRRQKGGAGGAAAVGPTPEVARAAGGGVVPDDDEVADDCRPARGVQGAAEARNFERRDDEGLSVTFTVSCEGDDVPVTISFDQTSTASFRNKIMFDSPTLRALEKCCIHDDEEEAEGRFFGDKRIETRGGCLSLAARVHDYLLAKIRNTPEFERGERDYIINHAFTIKMLINALRYGATYLESTNDELQKLSLLVVTPIEDGENRYITLCFGVSDEGAIKHCYHCCRQRNHPKDVREGRTLKYRLAPIQVNATMHPIKKKLELSFPIGAFGAAKRELFKHG